MRRIPSISTLMTPFPWHLDSGGCVADARALMVSHDVCHLPVTNDAHEVLGILCLDELPDTDDPVMDWVAPVPTVDSHTRADEVLEMMAESGQLVVTICHHSRLAGIITWSDVCRHFAAQLREPFRPPEGDDVA